MALSEGMRIRRLAPADAQALVLFYNTLSPASKRTFRPIQEQTTLAVCQGIAGDNIAPEPIKCDWIVVYEDAIVGWSFIWNLDSDDPVFGLAIADAWHGKGLGTALMQQVMDWAKAQGLPKVTLTVVQDNSVAWRLYGKMGFVRCGAFTGDDGLDYYKMEWYRQDHT